MIRILLILLLATYILWVAYRYFSNIQQNRKNSSYNIFLPIVFLIVIFVGGYFLLPKLAVIFQKFVPFLTNPIGIFQVLIQKLLPLINIIRGILPI
jgi:hypothetical protein